MDSSATICLTNGKTTINCLPAGSKQARKKKIISQNAVPADSIIFIDAIVLLGSAGINQSQRPLRLVGYEVDRVKYWIATNRYNLAAEKISQAYKLHWNIENFFAW